MSQSKINLDTVSSFISEQFASFVTQAYYSKSKIALGHSCAAWLLLGPGYAVL